MQRKRKYVIIVDTQPIIPFTKIFCSSQWSWKKGVDVLVDVTKILNDHHV